jgi:hypothetical protein
MVSGSALSSVLSFRGCENVDCGVLDFDTMHHNLHFCGLVKKYWTFGLLEGENTTLCRNVRKSQTTRHTIPAGRMSRCE